MIRGLENITDEERLKGWNCLAETRGKRVSITM